MILLLPLDFRLFPMPWFFPHFYLQLLRFSPTIGLAYSNYCSGYVESAELDGMVRIAAGSAHERYVALGGFAGMSLEVAHFIQFRNTFS